MFLLSWPGGDWESTLKLIGLVGVLYIAALWLTLVFWTYRDIRQRTRDPIVQSVSVLLVLVFFLPGLWIYLILRPRATLAEMYERSLEEEALLQELEDQKACPACKRRIHDEYLICPSCRSQLKEPCRQCSKPLNYAWLACPFCGLEKPPRELPLPRRLPAPHPAERARAQRAPTIQRQPAAQPDPAPQRMRMTRRPTAPEAPSVPQSVGAAPEPASRPDPFMVRHADATPMIDATQPSTSS